MNKKLKETLEEYFYDGLYGEIPQHEEVIQNAKEMDKHIRALKLEKDVIFDLDERIAVAENLHELQGFLRGYEYCLTMLNLSGGGYGKWLMKLSRSITIATAPRYPPGSYIAS